MSDADLLLRTYPWLGAPTDASPLVADGDVLRATGDGTTYAIVRGIPQFIVPEDARRTTIIAEDERARYTLKRQPDALDTTTLQILPYATMPEEGPAAWIRKREMWEALHYLLEKAQEAGTFPTTPRVVDAGAGVGWLSRRLSLAGGYAVALDVSGDDRFGLGASLRIAGDPQAPFLPAQADFTRPPVQNGSVHLFVYSESLHYAPDIAKAIRRAAQTLAPGGWLVITDSPVAETPTDELPLTRATIEDALAAAALTVREWYEPAQETARLVQRITRRAAPNTPRPFIVAAKSDA